MPEIGYLAIAMRTGSRVEVIRNMRSNDPNFPAPVRHEGRSPLFDEGEVLAYLKARGATSGGRGRPRVGGEARILPAPADLDEIKAVMKKKGVTQNDMAQALGVPRVKIQSRLDGRTKWTRSDLERFMEVLGKIPVLKRLAAACSPS